MSKSHGFNKIKGEGVDFAEGGETSIHSKYETCSISCGLESRVYFVDKR